MLHRSATERDSGPQFATLEEEEQEDCGEDVLGFRRSCRGGEEEDPKGQQADEKRTSPPRKEDPDCRWSWLKYDA